jgi:hypothetical protein
LSQQHAPPGFDYSLLRATKSAHVVHALPNAHGRPDANARRRRHGTGCGSVVDPYVFRRIDDCVDMLKRCLGLA